MENFSRYKELRRLKVSDKVASAAIYWKRCSEEIDIRRNPLPRRVILRGSHVLGIGDEKRLGDCEHLIAAGGSPAQY
jgi:hypothetical protein